MSGGSSSKKIWEVNDGLKLTSFGTQEIVSVFHINTTWVFVGKNGKIASTQDFVSFTITESLYNDLLTTYPDGFYQRIVGNSFLYPNESTPTWSALIVADLLVYKSTDGITWTKVTSHNLTEKLTSLKPMGIMGIIEGLIGIGVNGTIYSANPDGSQWFNLFADGSFPDIIWDSGVTTHFTTFDESGNSMAFLNSKFKVKILTDVVTDVIPVVPGEYMRFFFGTIGNPKVLLVSTDSGLYTSKLDGVDIALFERHTTQGIMLHRIETRALDDSMTLLIGPNTSLYLFSYIGEFSSEIQTLSAPDTQNDDDVTAVGLYEIFDENITDYVGTIVCGTYNGSILTCTLADIFETW